jgi:integrase
MKTTIVDGFFVSVVNEPLVALSLWLNRGVKPKTRKADRERLEPFLRQFSLLTEIATKDVDAWIESLGERLAHNSRASHSESIRDFFNWCVRNNHIVLSASPVVHRLQRIRNARNKAASERDLQKLISYLRQGIDDPACCRDLLAIQLYYESGCRLREISTLTTKAMNEALRNGTLNGNGIVVFVALSHEGKRGSVPVRFTEYTAAIYRQWLKARPSGTNRVFTSILHKKRGKPVQPEALSNMIVRRCHEFNITPFRTHAIRHLKGTKTTDEYGPAVAAAMLSITFEVAQTHYYDNVEASVLNATG